MSIHIGFRSERGPILISLMVVSAMAAIEATIIATAVTSIVDELGGFAQFPWLFSIFLLAQAVTVPVYAKISDLIGRKPVIMFGIALFLVSSVLCGLAWSMPALIAFRGLQGLAAGAMHPMSITIAADIYSIAERAKVQGYFASVWAMGAVFGPAIGGVFAQFGLWRGIFFINVPICIVAGWLIWRNFHERVQRRKQRIDYAGALLLMASLSLIILALLEGGHSWAWDSQQSIAAFAIGGTLLIAFLIVEWKAHEPILPPWLLSRRLLVTTALLALTVGAIPGGLSSFTPLYLEGTLGVSPIVASVAVFTLAISWPMATMFAGRLYLRFGFRPTIIAGAFIVLIGMSTLVAFSSAPTVWLVTAGCFVTGFGMGLVATPTMVAAQFSVPWHERGVVSGTQIFARSIGNAIGVAVLGAIATAVFRGQDVSALDPATVATGIGAVYLGLLVVAGGAVIAALCLPRIPITPEPARDPGQ